MGGDGAGGLAMAILLVMIALVVGGFLVFYMIGRAATHKSPGKRRFLPWLLGLAGLGLGYLAIFPIFFESTWAPPPTIRFIVPAGFNQPSVILLEDPSSSNELMWTGSTLPFFGMTAEVAVPASGVLRVKSYGPAEGRADTSVAWSDRGDGASDIGGGGGPAPPGINAVSFMHFVRDQGANEPIYGGDEEAAAYIRRREAGQ